MSKLLGFFRTLKVTTSTILVLLGAAILAAPLYTALLPVEAQSLFAMFAGSILEILLVGGVVYVFFNWMFDSWRWGKKIVSTINLIVGLAVIALGAGLLVNAWMLGLWDGVFTAEHAAMVALVALGAGLADRSYVNIRYASGKRPAPAAERLAIPTKEEVVEAVEEKVEDLQETAAAKVAELTK